MSTAACCTAFALSALLYSGATPAAQAQDLAFQVSKAYQAALDGEFTAASLLGSQLMHDNPSDWRGWYLRSVGTRGKPLTPDELRQLEVIQPAEQREIIRGLVGYISAPKEQRLLLARDLVDRHPKSAVALGMLASRLLDAGQADEAVAAARAAIELDSTMFIAGRVEVLARDSTLSNYDVGPRACSLLETFRYDSFVVGRTLGLCQAPASPKARVGFYGTLLGVWRGTPLAGIVLSRIIGDGATDLGEAEFLELVRTLEPSDQSWWPHGWGLLQALGKDRSSLKNKEVRSFLEVLARASLNEAAVTRDPMLRDASLLAAESLDRAGRRTEALTLMRDALGALVPWRRAPHYQALGRLAKAEGMASEARDAEIKARLLEHPFEPLPPDLLAGKYGSERVPDNAIKALRESVLFRLGEHRVVGTDGEERALRLAEGPPRLLVFWAVGCGWVAREVERIHEMEADSRSAVRRHKVQVLWVNFDPVEKRELALKEVAGLDLDPKSVLFLRNPDPDRLDRVLHVYASPWLFLVTPFGEVVFENQGFNPGGWEAVVAGILDEAQRARVPWTVK